MKSTLSADEAAEQIRSGRIVAFPTETVYGLGADVWNIEAIKNTFRVKGRPADNPLIVHISSLDQLSPLVSGIPDVFYLLAERFWPGPLTFILSKKPEVPDIVTGGLDTVGIRMPDHPLALELIGMTGPLTAPSANLSGKPSPTKAQHVRSDFGKKFPVLDGGPATIGIESTVLDLTTSPPEILRPGAVTAEMINSIISAEVSENKKNSSRKVKSPGQKYTHYKPEASVTWLHSTPEPSGASAYYILHSERDFPPSKNVYAYSGDFSALARDLYDHFRNADYLGYQQIFIEPLPDDSVHPVVSALRNRIQKAAGE